MYKLKYPTFETTLPVSGKKVKFRPFNVGEQKVLLMQAEDGTEGNKIVETIDTCGIGVDSKDLCQADREFLFLQIRAKAIGERMQLGHKCECGKVNKFDLDLENDLKVTGTSQKDTIEVADGYALKMKMPSAALVEEMEKKRTIETVNAVLADSIEMIAYGEQVDYAKDIPKEDIVDFIKQLIDKDFQKLESWLLKQPKLYATVDYKCEECGKENHVIVSGLLSFF